MQQVGNFLLWPGAGLGSEGEVGLKGLEAGTQLRQLVSLMGDLHSLPSQPRICRACAQAARGRRARGKRRREATRLPVAWPNNCVGRVGASGWVQRREHVVHFAQRFAGQMVLPEDETNTGAGEEKG
jgi:hypothetical protein